MHSLQLLTALSLTTMLAAQAVDPQSSNHYLQVDSGLVQNNLTAPAAAGVPQVVWSHVVTVNRASWMRLHYHHVQLSGSAKRGADGSFLRLTSMRDGAVQLQHMQHVDEWQNTSAYFNGDSVLVELLAQPGTGDNRFVLRCAVAGPEQQGEPDSICGTVDDRQPSSDARVGRVGFGCTAWMINDCNHCFLSAGHCGVGGSTVIQFNVPMSSGSGSPQAPAPSDQYAVDPSSVQDQSGGASLGDDWVYFGCFDNSNTGLSPYAAQGSVAFDLINPPAVSGQTIRITGFGTTSSPVSPTWNQIQKTHSGPYYSNSSDVLRYTVDTTGGNSGSPVILDGTNNAIGIHTNAGCNSVGGNQGCGAANTSLQAALSNPQGICAQGSNCGGGGGGGGGSPLTTTFSSNNGQAGNMFDLRVASGTAPVVIDDFDVNLDSGNWDLEIYTTTSGGSHVGVEQDATAWTLVASIPGVVSNGANTPTPLGQSLNLTIDCGDQVGFYVTVSNGNALNYTTGTGFAVGDVYASNADLEVLAGTGNTYPFGSVFGPPTSSRIFNGNIYYTVSAGSCGGGGGSPATASTYGSGCVVSFTSFYEQLTQADMDLAGLEIWGTATAGGHTVNTRSATILAVGSLGSASALALGDDDQTTAGTLGLSVGSNGWVARGAGNSNDYVPDVSTMLDNPSEGYYAWTDLQPNAAGSGEVFYEESGTQWMVTYDGVYLWSTTDPVTIQFRGDESNGDFVIAFGALTNTGPEDWVIGHSGGGASSDPGPRDLSQGTLFGFLMGDQDREGLALAPIGAPVLGAPFQLQTTNIPSSAVFHVGILGLSQVTAPLAFAFPSAEPSCNLHASLDVIVGPQVVWGGSGSLTWTGLDLTSASALGASVYFQSATLDLTVLSDTVRTSNGVQGTTGL